MRILVITGLTLIMLAIGCENLPIGGKCHDRQGNEMSYVIDAQGTEWDVKKINYKLFGESVTGCAISRNAVLIEGGLWDKVETPNGDLIDVAGRHEDKWVLDPGDAEWY